MKRITVEKDINDEILSKYFNDQTPSNLLKDLLEDDHAKSEELVNNINDGLIDLRNAIIKKEIPGNKNPNKIIDVAGKVLDFNNQGKSKLLKY